MFTRYRKRTIIGVTVQMFAQLNGINIISFYLPTTLADAGFSTQKSLLYTAANAIPYTAATVATWWLADHWGRRPLLISGGVVMAVLLAIVCAFTEADMAIDMRANGQYAFIMLYNIVYGITWGPMPWLLPAEIFPLRSRSKGMALATVSYSPDIHSLSTNIPLTTPHRPQTGSSTSSSAWFLPTLSPAFTATST
jgi:MFS family permease